MPKRSEYVPDHIRTASDEKLIDLENKARAIMQRAVVQNFMLLDAHKVAMAAKRQLELIFYERRYRASRKARR